MQTAGGSDNRGAPNGDDRREKRGEIAANGTAPARSTDRGAAQTHRPCRGTTGDVTAPRLAQ